MKAEDDLRKAKKNRNQLVFSNGGWEYDYNQDDIISKIEAVADAEKDIADNQKENQGVCFWVKNRRRMNLQGPGGPGRRKR